MKLTGLDILLTYECSGRCAHCCYRAGPGRGHTMTLTEVAGYLEQVTGQPLTQGILLFGGEPFLCYGLLRDSIALAAPLARVLVFTNGCWATSPSLARERLEGLQTAGLDHILFSVDAFHQAHVPLERVAIGIEAARASGFATIEIDNRFLGGVQTAHPVNQETTANMSRLAELCDLTDVKIHRGPARMVGRAADELSSQVARAAAAASRCPLPDYLGGDLLAPTCVEIHPGGWVNLCAGLALGNASRRPLRRILAEYDSGAHPVIRVLAREGPTALLTLARAEGRAPPDQYVDGCHMCYEARRLLHGHYPETLAPAFVYGAD